MIAATADAATAADALRQNAVGVGAARDDTLMIVDIDGAAIRRSAAATADTQRRADTDAHGVGEFGLLRSPVRRIDAEDHRTGIPTCATAATDTLGKNAMRPDAEGVDEPVVGDYHCPAGLAAAATAADGHREVDLDLELLADLFVTGPLGHRDVGRRRDALATVAATTTDALRKDGMREIAFSRYPSVVGDVDRAAFATRAAGAAQGERDVDAAGRVFVRDRNQAAEVGHYRAARAAGTAATANTLRLDAVGVFALRIDAAAIGYIDRAAVLAFAAIAAHAQ